jgi:hypothetical protein
MLKVNLSRKCKVQRLTDTLAQVDEYYVGENRKSIPSSIDYDVAPVPELARMAHARLGQLLLVHLRLIPLGFRDNMFLNHLTSIKDEYIVDNPLLAVALSPSEDNEVLAKLR